ncbi:hypothetical protein AMATHDRAFT_73272 [Amanita thiersii Skay4041]|uniref:RRM domain-containing protein n=1 Tax=Amanita thiersii Skay4041 TaxID=703135 RepID=A0A2A9NSC0_9AGAR|nr:hypothetical protein AMATHDRAFT_73272 [Amanita thiersii Skay4041]
MSKVVFVGNVPYNMGEEQLIDVFKSVGQVIGFRLVFDRDTGKPKGYGFCEFADHETAASAVRNLNNVDVGGRPLRIDLADSDPYLEGKTTVRGELVDSGGADHRPGWRGGGRGQEPNAFLAGVPPGVQLPKGVPALDHISQTLASMPPSQLMEVLAQMKAFVITYPEHARTLLVSHPQLAYALFQALLLNKIVDSAILQRMLEATGAGAPPVAPPIPPPTVTRPPIPPPHLQHPISYPQMPYPTPPLQQPQPVPGMPPPPMSVPPPGAMFPHHQPLPGMPPIPPYYRPPPPPAPQVVPSAQPPTQTSAPQAPAQPPQDISESQRSMLMQVLSLTQEQIDALPETERQAIVQLRTQFMGTLGV